MPFSLSKAAKVAGVSKTTMHKWVKSGKLSATKATPTPLHPTPHGRGWYVELDHQ